MKILIVAATAMEIAPFTAHLGTTSAEGRHAEVLITGVGMTATTYALTKKLQTTMYDLVLQAGVGGSFDSTIALGELVLVTSDRYGDTGAEDHDNYSDIFDMELLDANEHPHTGGLLINPMGAVQQEMKLRHVSGLTVNTVSGSERTIKQRTEKYGCAVESMEGAAFHYVCLQEGVAFAQVRAISNYVIPRDKSQWRMKEAIVNLNKWLIAFVEGMNEQ